MSAGRAPGSLARAGHRAMPVEDSWYCERTTWPANLKAYASYPVIAQCERCHGRIRRAAIGQEDWAHVPAEPAVRGTAEDG